MFDSGAFDASAYAPDDAPSASPELIALGRQLFHDARLSGPGTRSCASCHDPARAFTDGRKLSEPVKPGTRVSRNTPTLLNAAYQPAMFADFRAGSLEAQAQAVLASPAEMASSAEIAAAHLKDDSAYRTQFARVFRTGKSADSAVSGRAVRTALAAYVRSLSALDAPFDRSMRGDTTALDSIARKGFTVFMGKARCGSCHFVPLFNGTFPPDFVTSEPEIIDVPERQARHHARLDPDSGRGGIDHEPAHLHSFKVPTVRNVAVTAPYMHNGVFADLEQVVEFYDRGGGAGIGILSPAQTLPARKLQLTQHEKVSLLAFLKALTDTAPAGNAAVQ
jgi:cytochrome c peroxidase